MTRSDFKLQARIKDPELLSLLKLTYDCCEVTGITSGLHLHHVIFKSQQGDDVRANIICLHEELHERYHRMDPRAMRLVGELVDRKRHDVAYYIEAKLGGAPSLVEWFARHGVMTPEGGSR